jgi:hypothetical protein
LVRGCSLLNLIKNIFRKKELNDDLKEVSTFFTAVEKKSKTYKDCFQMPKPIKITGRSSSITNSFINGIVPCIQPKEEDVAIVLGILGMDCNTICCVYCGDKHTEWDHFRPLIENKKATGYISEISNLVPACGKCNQSKGNSNWKEWITGQAKLSPASRGINDIEQRIENLEAFEILSNPVKLDFEKIVGRQRWEKHWANCEIINNQMRESQQLSDEIRAIVNAEVQRQNFESNQNYDFYKGSYVSTEINKDSLVERIHQKATLKEMKKTNTAFNFNSNVLRSKPVGIIAKQYLGQVLENGDLDVEIIKFLQDKNYSKNTFDINYPIIKRIKSSLPTIEESIDHLGRNRYYAKPLKIYGSYYLLTSQWYDRNKTYLIKWLMNHSSEC